MKIGVDLDGVIFDSEKFYRVFAEIYEVQNLKRNTIIDNCEFRVQERYQWTNQEFQEFLDKYHEIITRKSHFMPGVKEVLYLLKQEGHTFVLITARGKINSSLIPITEKRLQENDLFIFESCHWGIERKEEVCIKENVDLMIDDNLHNCLQIAKQNIKTIYFKDAPSPMTTENEFLKICYNWGEVYRYFKQKNK